MYYVIIRSLLMSLCLERVNIIDDKVLSNQFVVFKDYVKYMFHEMLRIFSIFS